MNYYLVRARSEAKKLRSALDAVQFWKGQILIDEDNSNVDPHVLGLLKSLARYLDLDDVEPGTKESFLRDYLFGKINKLENEFEEDKRKILDRYRLDSFVPPENQVSGIDAINIWKEFRKAYLKPNAEGDFKYSKFAAYKKFSDFVNNTGFFDPAGEKGLFRSVSELKANFLAAVQEENFRKAMERLYAQAERNENGWNEDLEELLELDALIKEVAIQTEDDAFLYEVFENGYDFINPFLNNDKLTLGADTVSNIVVSSRLVNLFASSASAYLQFLIKRHQLSAKGANVENYGNFLDKNLKIQKKLISSSSPSPAIQAKIIKIDELLLARGPTNNVPKVDYLKGGVDKSLIRDNFAPNAAKIIKAMFDVILFAVQTIDNKQNNSLEGDIRLLNSLTITLTSVYEAASALKLRIAQKVPQKLIRHIGIFTGIIGAIFATMDTYKAYSDGENLGVKIGNSFMLGGAIIGVVGTVAGVTTLAGPISILLSAIASAAALLAGVVLVIGFSQTDFEKFQERNYFSKDWKNLSVDNDAYSHFAQISFRWKERLNGEAVPNFNRQIVSLNSLFNPIDVEIKKAYGGVLFRIKNPTTENPTIFTQDSILRVTYLGTDPLIGSPNYVDDPDILFSMPVKYIGADGFTQTNTNPPKISAWKKIISGNQTIGNFSPDDLEENSIVEVDIIIIPELPDTSDFRALASLDNVIRKRLKVDRI